MPLNRQRAEETQVALIERVRIGLALPQVFVDEPVDPQQTRVVAQRAEALGLDSLWTQSQLVGRAAVLEPITTLSFVAACTERIRLGIAVVVVTEHQPVQLAKQLATLDHLAQGRLVVSLGTGAPGVTAAVGGLPMDRPVARLLETAQLMRHLWTDEVANFDGQFWQLRDVSMEPKPIQQPHPPLWLSGIHPNALSRAARLGSGWMGPGAVSVERFRSLVVTLEEALVAAGRDRREFTIAKRLYLVIDDDERVALERANRRLFTYGAPPDPVEDLAALGGLDRVAARIDEVIAAGADLVVLNPLVDLAGHLDPIAELVARR